MTEASDAGQDTAKDKDQVMVPKDRLDAVLGELRNVKAELAKRPETNVAPPAAQKPAPSRTELQKKVEAGELSVDDAQAELDRPAEERVTEKVVGKIAGANQAQNVQTEMSRYIEAHPDLKVEGSELRGRVLAEFGYQTQILGHQGKSAELAAVRAILGPLEKPKATIRVDTTREGYSGAGGTTKEDADDTKADLSPKERAYYKNHIGPGKLYKSWDEVNKMVGAHANPHIRTPHSNHPVI